MSYLLYPMAIAVAMFAAVFSVAGTTI